MAQADREGEGERPIMGPMGYTSSDGTHGGVALVVAETFDAEGAGYDIQGRRVRSN
jgi:hypothetical protein